LPSRALRFIKPEIRVLGVDDGKFVPHSKTQVLVVGVVFRAGLWVEGVMSTRVAVDGLDGTAKLASMIMASPHYKQLRVVMLNGVTFGGFNVVDIKALNTEIKLPVLAVTTRKPDLAKVHAALKNLPNCEERWSAILNAGEIFSVATHGNKQQVYVEIAGITKETSIEILRLTVTRSKTPEPLRVAHLVASGISLY
jgi:endonuclease V-like protein UPF0215 family